MFKTYSCVHVGRRVPVRVSQHGDDADHDRLNGVDRKPALLRFLITKLVLSGFMQDGDAHVTILCNWRRKNKEGNQKLRGSEHHQPNNRSRFSDPLKTHTVSTYSSFISKQLVLVNCAELVVLHAFKGIYILPLHLIYLDHGAPGWS